MGMRPQSIKICGVRSPVRHMPWRSFSAAREEAVTGRVVLRGTSGMIGANSGIMRIFFLFTSKGSWLSAKDNGWAGCPLFKAR